MIPHNKPKEIKKHVKIFIVSSILGLVLLFVHSFLNDRIYPEVGFDQQISGKILNVIPYQSIVKIELVDGRRFRFNSARNYQYDPYQMNEFLKKEDFIKKNIKSDTVYIKRGSEDFIFVVGKHLNVNLRKD